MKRVLFFSLLLNLFSGDIFAFNNEPEILSSPKAESRSILVKLNGWNAETIQVLIQKQDGSIVYQDNIDGTKTDAQSYILAGMEEGDYQMILRNNFKTFSQTFSIADKKLIMSRTDSEILFEPALESTDNYPDNIMQVKEQYYKHFNKDSDKN
jgi:hypothetical protein